MKKLVLLIMLCGAMFSALAEDARTPYAPAGANWKYWYADAQTTGYIKLLVLEDDVPLTGYINGTDELITVNCSKIFSGKGLWAYEVSDIYEITEDYDKYDDDYFYYMFREGNKAYLYDMFDSTFYKMIDMDAQPGDRWEMTLLNGSYYSEYQHTEFTHDPESHGVPEELLPFFEANRTLFITDDNWACNLSNEDFADDLMDLGIDSTQIALWIADNPCTTTGQSLESDTSSYYVTATALLDARNYPYTTETWACDFKYYHKYIEAFGYRDIAGTDRDAIMALCGDDINTLVTPNPMPIEILSLWDQLDRYDKDGVSNYNYKLLTDYNWPGYVTTISYDIKKSIEDGGLGLTTDEVDSLYTHYNVSVYEDIPQAGDKDWIEVTEKKDVVIDGLTIPVISMGPACESMNSTSALRSMVQMSGMYNIDYLNLSLEPWPELTSENENNAYEILHLGLLCIDNGEYSLTTDKMTEYFATGLKDKYAAGHISCDSLTAPDFTNIETKSTTIPQQSSYMPTIINDEVELKAAAIDNTPANDPDTVLYVNTVVHVIHNEDNPASKISESQINAMISAINDAFMATNDQSDLHQDFADVVGKAAIKLRLTDEAPSGASSTGIVYYPTTIDYYTLSGDQNNLRYAYKYDDQGNPRTWDNEKYLNIFIADFGAKDSLASAIGGFVTNPVVSSENQDQQIAWLESNDTAFWSEWLRSETSDADELDGLTLDYHATFNENYTDKWKYKTAIHELGHYFGLRHTASILVENRESIPYPPYYRTTEVLYGDNFEDTPEQPYQISIYDNCARELYTCGVMAQINNFMGYSLPCANMFTVEQAEFMREFTSSVRPGIISKEVTSGLFKLGETSFTMAPNPTEGLLNITLKNDEDFSVNIYALSGQLMKTVNNAYGQATISIADMKAGIYAVQINTKTSSTIQKVVKQ